MTASTTIIHCKRLITLWRYDSAGIEDYWLCLAHRSGSNGVLCLMSAGLYQEFFECDDNWVISSVKPIEFKRVRNPAQVRQSDPLDRRRIFDLPILPHSNTPLRLRSKFRASKASLGGRSKQPPLYLDSLPCNQQNADYMIFLRDIA